MSTSGFSQSRHPQSQQTASRWTDEAFFPKNTEFTSGSYMAQFEEELSPASQMKVDEGTDSTQALMKRRCDRRSCLSNALRARLGPQAPGVEGQPCVSETLKAHLGPSSTVVMLEWPFSAAKETTSWGPCDPSSTRLCQSTTGWHALHAIRPSYY